MQVPEFFLEFWFLHLNTGKVQGATMNTDKMESRSPSSTDRSKQSVRRKPTLIENSGLCPVGWLAQISGASPSPVAATSQSAPWRFDGGRGAAATSCFELQFFNGSRVQQVRVSRTRYRVLSRLLRFSCYLSIPRIVHSFTKRYIKLSEEVSSNVS